MGRFDGKVALVTGGGTGIGKATALMFAREGAKVVIGNRNEQRGRAVVEEIVAAGGAATFRRTDVTQESDVQALVGHAVDTYGRIDAAFNNAGVAGPPSSILEATNETFDYLFDINVRGVWLCMKHEITQMLAQGGGSVVNCSSIIGLVGFRALGLYSATKHAVEGLTKSAALEFATANIRINSVNPAVIETPLAEGIASDLGVDEATIAAMHPIGRKGQPHEVATAVLYLCSNEASFITGQPIVMDGGYTAQ